MTQNNPFPKMTQLARTFPMFADQHMWPNSLWVGHGPKADSPGLDPFDPMQLAKCAGAWSSGEQSVVRFLLFVFSGDDITEYGLGAFSLRGSLGNWDDPNRRAFLAWATSPWWQ